jgi:uncharacterized protein YjlB
MIPPGLGQKLIQQAVFRGSSTLLVGVGPLETEALGQEIYIEAGDVIILPAGVSHCSKESQNHYTYIGAYPDVSLGIPMQSEKLC